MRKKQFKIKYLDLWGLRKDKYKFLEVHDIKNTKWQELTPKESHYFYVPKDTTGEEKYKKFISLTDIFSFNNVGGKPGDDALLVGDNKNDLKVKINQFVQLLKIDKSKARTEADRNLLQILDKFEIQEENLIPYNYRPFDIKQTYYDNQIYTRAVPKLRTQFKKENICLLTTKILKAENFAHIFVSAIFPDVIFLSNKTSTNTFVFPLYLYESQKETNQRTLLGNDKTTNKKSNIKNDIIQKLSNNYKCRITPEEIFYYIYSILYSNVYRKKYNEFLKIDFPRIPFTKDYELFQKVSKLGKELTDLHLLKSKVLEKPVAKFLVTGDSGIKKREYKNNKIHINDKQYFDGIKPEVWNYYIGGYQVLDKWLKDRIGKILSSEEVNHFLKIISALEYTIKLQKEVDKIYPEVEKNLITFKT